MVIEKGAIKVVWPSRNRKKIFSKMFESENEAEKFGRKKNNYYLKLTKQSSDCLQRFKSIILLTK